MDQLEHAWYEEKFTVAYLRAKGDIFQTFFEDLMSRAHKADFMACRPWGNRGDRKNDGFLKSQKRLFQVYAPYEMTEKAAIEKITEDFEGAKPHWGKYFTAWTFAHNADDGLPPHVQTLILDLEHNNPEITIDPWGLEEFRIVFRKIEREDLQSWFGYAPNSETKSKLGFQDLRVVLMSMAAQEPVIDYSPEDVDPGKIEANRLSKWIKVQIREGRTKMQMVGDFFARWPDPTFGEQVAIAFRRKYRELRDQQDPELTPDQIYRELVVWVAGSERDKPEHEMAVITIIAYYFESCDIFEPAPQPLPMPQ